MPFSAILEVVLQPCGWLAAYGGPALRSEEDLHFRNLGGSAVLHEDLGAEPGELATRIKLTGVSETAGMTLLTFDFSLKRNGKVAYEGQTSFGFFSTKALAQQAGIQGAHPYEPSAQEMERAERIELPDDPPLTPTDVETGVVEGLALPARAYRMLDCIEVWIPDGGPHGLGFLRGVKKVDPDEWFFKAHFHQDPVCPGSLGLEAFVQLLKVDAIRRWGDAGGKLLRFEPIALGIRHEWIYRGQILPSNDKVVVEAVIREVEEKQRTIHADGYLSVDGLLIYQMKNFAIRAVADVEMKTLSGKR
jgi:3-hydroxymyristoyl/3-hydroxydecanoyl-(acyl carrier protein) dehydratase